MLALLALLFLNNAISLLLCPCHYYTLIFSNETQSKISGEFRQVFIAPRTGATIGCLSTYISVENDSTYECMHHYVLSKTRVFHTLFFILYNLLFSINYVS